MNVNATTLTRLLGAGCLVAALAFPIPARAIG